MIAITPCKTYLVKAMKETFYSLSQETAGPQSILGHKRRTVPDNVCIVISTGQAWAWTVTSGIRSSRARTRLSGG